MSGELITSTLGGGGGVENSGVAAAPPSHSRRPRWAGHCRGGPMALGGDGGGPNHVGDLKREDVGVAKDTSIILEALG